MGWRDGFLMGFADTPRRGYAQMGVEPGWVGWVPHKNKRLLFSLTVFIVICVFPSGQIDEWRKWRIFAYVQKWQLWRFWRIWRKWQIADLDNVHYLYIWAEFHVSDNQSSSLRSRIHRKYGMAKIVYSDCFMLATWANGYLPCWIVTDSFSMLVVRPRKCCTLYNPFTVKVGHWQAT